MINETSEPVMLDSGTDSNATNQESMANDTSINPKLVEEPVLEDSMPELEEEPVLESATEELSKVEPVLEETAEEPVLESAT